MTTVVGARIHALYTSPGHDFRGHHGGPRGHNPIIDSDSISCVAGKGIEGDRYFGREEHEKGKITFFDWAVFEAIRTHFAQPELSPSVLRRNVVILGLDLNALVDRTFEIQGVHFEGTAECSPCYWMDQAVAPGTEAFMKGRGGLRARILSGGTLSKGAVAVTIHGAAVRPAT